MTKPLGRKAYGSIGHLPGSRLGPGDRHVNQGHARMCLERAKRPGDKVIVQEKADGTCVAVAKVGGRLVPIQRKGYHCLTSPHVQHQLFAGWVLGQSRLGVALEEGWRMVGEWLVQAHGTLYRDPVAPFVAFDVFDEFNQRLPVDAVRRLCAVAGVQWAAVLHEGDPVAVEDVRHPNSRYERRFANDTTPEGLVYRVERGDRTILIAKWVRPDYEPGRYLPGIGLPDDAEPIWHLDMWRAAA